MNNLTFLSLFLAVIIGLLSLDLLVIGRKQHVVTYREALIWSSIWISLSFLFFLFLRYRGEIIHSAVDFTSLSDYMSKYYPVLDTEGLSFDQAIQSFRKALSFSYLSGYLIEKTLSLDNLFVILMIFQRFQVPQEYYKKILFWGILGAIILRFLFIFLGAALIQKFEWTLYIFGIFLLYTGLSLIIKRKRDSRKDLTGHFIIKALKKVFPVSDSFESGRFFVRTGSRLIITPLFLVLLLVEFTDLLFAMDSIPAIFGVTRDPYIVFYANIFAILGLRSMFFLIANLAEKFRFLKTGISVLLGFIGMKLLLHHWFIQIGFTPIHSLFVIAAVIATSILLSVIFPRTQ